MTRIYCFHQNWFQIVNVEGGQVKVCRDCGAHADALGKWPVVDVLEQWPQVIEEKGLPS